MSPAHLTQKGKQPPRVALASEAQATDQAAVAAHIGAVQIGQEALAASHQLEQTQAGMLIMLVDLEVLGQLGDTSTEERDLHFRGAGVVRLDLELLDPLLLLALRDGG